MKLSLKITGGLGNLPIQGQLDTAELPTELAARVEELMQPERLRAFAGRESEGRAAGSADHLHYQVVLLGAESSSFELDETVVPPELLEVIDELAFQITSQLTRLRRGEPD